MFTYELKHWLEFFFMSLLFLFILFKGDLIETYGLLL